VAASARRGPGKCPSDAPVLRAARRVVSTSLFLRVDSSRPPALPSELACVEIPFGARLTVGRTEHADIVVPHDQVSTRHALIEHGEGGCTIQDSHSTSGVFVNYRRLARGEARPVGPGDEIKLGGVYFLIHERPPLPERDNTRYWIGKLTSDQRDERWTAAQRLCAVHLTSSSARLALAVALKPGLADEYEPVRRWARRAVDRVAPIHDEDTIS
jgi:hypothetical protein